MRFPLPLTLRIAGHIVKNRLRRVGKFATVLQLEPLHTCNLTCTGCGRIREYSTSMKDVMPLADCLGAATECDAPMVSICGGEPLLYPEIEALVDGLLKQKRIVYLCTNALWMRRKMRDYLAVLLKSEPQRAEPLINRLLEEQLMTEKEAEAIRSGPKEPGKPVIKPTIWMYWNVHLDGLEKTHDIIVEREGVYRECILAIRMAKLIGYQVATNTTVYKETDPAEIEQLFEELGQLGVDGHTVSPGYEYDAAKRDMAARLNIDPATFFLTREGTHEKFAKIEEWGRRYPILGTPIYLEFLAGKRQLPCAAWSIPTRNIKGWKGPCYFMTDFHHATFRDMITQTNWDRYGVEGPEYKKARDPRCENCMTQCGFEPAATLGLASKRGDVLKQLLFNLRKAGA